eukprot:366260-Chlamydomonas_euryale.AAC.19
MSRARSSHIGSTASSAATVRPSGSGTVLPDSTCSEDYGSGLQAVRHAQHSLERRRPTRGLRRPHQQLLASNQQQLTQELNATLQARTAAARDAARTLPANLKRCLIHTSATPHPFHQLVSLPSAGPPSISWPPFHQLVPLPSAGLPSISWPPFHQLVPLPSAGLPSIIWSAPTCKCSRLGPGQHARVGAVHEQRQQLRATPAPHRRRDVSAPRPQQCAHEIEAALD